MPEIPPQTHPKNKKPLALIGTGGFLLSFVSSFFIVFSCSLFLKTLGAQALPEYYIVLNILSAFLGAYLFARDFSGVSGLWISNIFDDLAVHCPRQEVYADFSAFLETGMAGGKEKEKAEKFFSLALKYALGWKTGEEVKAKLMGRGETGDLAREIIESSIQDARMKELLYNLFRILKPPPSIS